MTYIIQVRVNMLMKINCAKDAKVSVDNNVRARDLGYYQES